ncbi:hypothetical protein SADUNF_Sadunf16G0258200 [Salix dunnii]|uniref:Uncharacterized protein n=1 Tax=Salix dunnii TaxID=1413687 RepID=A0A835JC37_9ROSI|nr:hypothetical protein SADUNF_Sadunf16G0258200 [Salix dunnii]
MYLIHFHEAFHRPACKLTNQGYSSVNSTDVDSTTSSQTILPSQIIYKLLAFHLDMDRLSKISLIFTLILICHAPSFEARKFLRLEKTENPSLKDSTAPSYYPADEGHATVVDERLIVYHLSRIDRILRSVPSPGTGN